MKHLIWLMCILLLAGCASKKYTKRASKFEEPGLYKDASEYYYEAEKRKPSNVEAKLGLRKNGQITLDQKLENFMEYYRQPNYKQAVYTYLSAEKYYNKIKGVGVELTFGEEYKSYYQDAKEEHLSSEYAYGVDLLNQENFQLAHSVFSSIMKIDANYKDVKEKYSIAKYEPKYREAIELLERGHFRQAYYTFDYIIKNTNDYKQATAYKEEALEKATITVLIVDFAYTNRANKTGAKAITSLVKEKIIDRENPFLKVVEPLSVKTSIYDVTGKLVRTLLSEKKEAGFYSIEWDGTDNNGKDVNSGQYIYKIQAGSFEDTKRCLLLK